jgi:hypothetical protein
MSVLNLCKTYGLKEPEVGIEKMWFYYKQWKFIQDNTMNEKPPVLNYNVYIDKIKAAFGVDSKQYLIARLYGNVPLRDNYSNIIVIEKAEDMPPPVITSAGKVIAKNYIVVPKVGVSNVIIQNAKTTGRHGAMKEKYTEDDMTALINAYMAKNNIKYGDELFGNLKVTIPAMNKRVGVDGAINTLRHMVVSTLYFNPHKTIGLILRQIDCMMHEKSTWFSYIQPLRNE